MSLEEALVGVKEALEENNALLRKITASAEKNLKGAAKATEPKGRSEEDEGDGDDDDDDTAPKGKKRGRPAGGTKKAKEKAPTAAVMKDRAGAYLDAADDDDDYQERRKVIKGIVAKFGAPKFTEIAEGDRAEALAMLDEAEKKGAAEDDEDDDI